MHKMVKEKLENALQVLGATLKECYGAESYQAKYNEVLNLLATIRHKTPDSEEYEQYRDVFWYIVDIIDKEVKNDTWDDAIGDIGLLLNGSSGVYGRIGVVDAHVTEPEEVYKHLLGQVSSGSN